MPRSFFVLPQSIPIALRSSLPETIFFSRLSAVESPARMLNPAKSSGTAHSPLDFVSRCPLRYSTESTLLHSAPDFSNQTFLNPENDSLTHRAGQPVPFPLSKSKAF